MEIVFIGCGGHSKVCIDIAKALNLSIFGIVDKNAKAGTTFQNIKILGDDKVINDLDPAKYGFVLSIGKHELRQELVKVFANRKLNWPTLIHPSAVIGSNVTIDAGTVVMPGAVINADARIGKFCVINTNASVDHDCICEDFVQISPGATLAGQVTVEHSALVGAGATIIPGRTIHRGAIIGAGAVVVKDVPSQQTYIGVPAKPI